MTNIKFIKIIVLAFLLFSDLVSVGQQKGVVNNDELDKKYIPNASSIFNTLNKKKDDSYSSEATFKNIVKFCPTMLARLKIMFYYERELMKHFTVNVGIGKAFGDDFFQRSYFGFRYGVESALSEEKTKLTPYDMLKEGKFDKSFPLLYLGARVYFSSSTFDEGFIEIGYRYESMEYLLNPFIGGERVDGSNRAVYKMHGFNFGYGYTELMGPKNNISQEIHINFGLKFFTCSLFDRVKDPTSAMTDVYIYQKSNIIQKALIVPAINISYCIGFGF